ARAESHCGPQTCVGEGEGTFVTFSLPPSAGGCPNQAFRAGASASLPDCRAYELVTLPNTNGHAPKGPGGSGTGDAIGTAAATAAGDSVVFKVEGGLIPGLDGAAGFQGDVYRSIRTADGWETVSSGPDGSESSNPAGGALSSDHEFSSWWALGPDVSGTGSLLVDGKEA